MEDIREERIETGFERERGSTLRVGFQRKGIFQLEPEEVAANNLNKALAEYSEFTAEARQQLQKDDDIY
ncbi:unnamed protein product [marine sediment metagenome]|uniref:Uncharacterized protein n=1 Tax=marine sediment metagenome TaxID=412755 RepID=X1I8Q0_9ZZZZ